MTRRQIENRQAMPDSRQQPRTLWFSRAVDSSDRLDTVTWPPPEEDNEGLKWRKMLLAELARLYIRGAQKT